MQIFEEKKNCCGCTACMVSCPKKAITMVEDEEGFLYPSINEKLCVECGICKKVCPFIIPYSSDEVTEVEVYAIKHKSEGIRMESASGGVFTALSDEIISNEGVVYGAKFDENFNVLHSRAINRKERNSFRGSKYVQSFMGYTFKQVKKDLIEGKYVLFTGTPCQVAGLNKYLNKKYENLLTCDIVCHGTPSPKIFSEFIEYIQERNDSKVLNLSFRDKEQGWENQKWKVEFRDGNSYVEGKDLRIFRRFFYKHYIHRPACHNCKYTNLKRPSDITIGDFWGDKEAIAKFVDNKGISLVLINTSKGEAILNDIKKDVELIKCDINKSLQPQLKYPTEKSEARGAFWKDYYSKGFKYVAKKYGNYKFSDKVKICIKKILK